MRAPDRLALPLSRRAVLGRLALLALGSMAAPAVLRAAARPLDPPVHPEPRDGITAELVLADEALGEKATRKEREGYRAAREHPAVLDGLCCYCDCAKRDGRRSLLSCFESRMPLSCGVCVGEARLAATLAKEGRTLEEIRRAVDEEWG